MAKLDSSTSSLIAPAHGGLSQAAPPEMLIATIGRSSQVETRTFDELFFNRRVPLRHVVWIHSREEAPFMAQSLARVRHEIEHFYKPRCPEVTFEFVTIKGRTGNCPVDTRTREDAEAVMFTLHEQLVRWKAQNYTVHLSITGGAKLIATLGVAAAQLTFDSDRDKCWHLVSQDQVASRTEMHVVPEVSGDEVHLIPVPVLRWKTWKQLPSHSLAKAIAQDPLHAQDIANQLGASEMFGWRCEFVESKLNSDDRNILERVSLLGWDNEEIDVERGGNCKNSITRIWRAYCQFIHAKCVGSSCDHGDVLRALDKTRLRRGRLIADFHIVFQHLHAKHRQGNQFMSR